MSHNGSSHSPAAVSEPIPTGTFASLPKYFRYDFVSGFLVFLIALPLCLSIALAYGYPAIAGVFTAIVGGIAATFLSNSELTIKGPAAGLIAIAAPCMMDFGWSGVPGDFSLEAYRAALAVGVAAGIIQILFGVFRVGSLGEFFPSAPVHGMLAAIGVIIIIKCLPVTIGVSAKGSAIDLFLGLPQLVQHLNGSIAIVGLVSLAIMFGWPLLKMQPFQSVPAAMVVLVVSIPLAQVLGVPGLSTNRLVLGQGHGPAPKAAAKETPSAPTTQAPDTMVAVPKFGETFNALTFPSFGALAQPKAWKWVFMFAIIGTLESMLTAKAMDLIDPWKRKTSLNRDNLAVGICNTLCALIGAAPMISEIVRSRANLDNGARTRFANMYHGLFLLLFVTLLPVVIGLIPIAALMAMLIYTGFRLAHPREFVQVYKVGIEQLVVFTVTLVAVVVTDLLMGIAIGIALEAMIYVASGMPLGSLFKQRLDVVPEGDDTCRVVVGQSAVFSNWISCRRTIVSAGLAERKNIVVDLSETRLVDHTVMEKLHELEREFDHEGLNLEVTGLENHRPLSKHPHAARKRQRVAEAVMAS